MRIDEHMHAVLASAIGQYFPCRCFHICFKSEPYYMIVGQGANPVM